MEVEAVVNKQNQITLPTKSIIGEVDFRLLVSTIKTYKDQYFAKPTNKNDPYYSQKLLAYNNHKPLDTVTSLELWNFIKNYNYLPLNNSIPSSFMKYSELETRVLPKDRSFVETKPFFFAKQLSPYWSINSPIHKEYFYSLFFESANCEVWLGQVYENKTYLNIHAYQLHGDYLRVTHLIPILSYNY